MAQNTKQLYTIGYSGHTPETFIQTLKAQQISLLLDIRLTPISRKKGFSKTALFHALEDAGISYQHLPTLGSPVELRRHLSADGNYEQFFSAFRAYLGMQGKSLQVAAELAVAERVCLMCVEKCPLECHRSVVADAIVQVLDGPVTVEHLPPPALDGSKTNGVALDAPQ